MVGSGEREARVGRRAAGTRAALLGGGLAVAGLLSGCAAQPGSGSAAEAPAAAATAATGAPEATPAADAVYPPAPTPQHVSASGDGPGTVEIPNPYYPLAEGRDHLAFTMTFQCVGDGGFWVQLLPESSGSYSGGTTCGGGTGTRLQMSKSQEVYVLDIRADPGTTWTLTGTLARG